MSPEQSDVSSIDELSSTTSESHLRGKKRKRGDKEYDEIEVNVAAPEPPSKKALRKAKQGKATQAVPGDSNEDADAGVEEKGSKRSEFGVWVGNLPWSAGKPELTKFMLDNAEISESDITRIHMPAPAKLKMDPGRQKLQPQNKGFAYVDFKTELACKAVIALSEKLLTGRRLLIKNANSYEGRPDAAAAAAAGATNGKKEKSPSKRIFVGNLTFDTTEDDLKEQFTKCGRVDNVFMATFEDSGQCKGYAWISFREVQSAEHAVRGWIDWKEHVDEDKDNDDKDDGGGGGGGERAKKVRKWWINRLKGRELRIEFAEDPSTRYQKRFGSGTSRPKTGAATEASTDGYVVEDVTTEDTPRERMSRVNSLSIKGVRPKSGQFSNGSSSSYTSLRPRIDARTVAPGAALSKAPRQSAAIVQAAGTKVTFD